MGYLTGHAQKRMQQRGIRPEALDLLLACGTLAHDHHGATIYFFDGNARSRLVREWGERVYKRVERQLGLYAVVGEDGGVITVGHRSQRRYRH